jgi:L-glyceraldehyde 3-phosphate reductase
MSALAHAIKQGKALYAGISNYPADRAKEAAGILRKLGTPCLIHQPKYSMFERWVENGLLDVVEQEGMGLIAFSPLAQGLLTDRYLKGIPEGSRASKVHGFLKQKDITPEKLSIISKLNDIALSRGQTLAQMAIVWLLKDNRVTSVLIGASSVDQLNANLEALKNPGFSKDELEKIESILK